jgi:adenosylmethionine-8-amino-7-oxononanoate aminotransferase
LTTEEIYRAFLGRYDEWKTFFHGHSYTGNPLGCAVALANIRLFKQARTLVTLKPKIARLTRMLKSVETLAHVGDVRQIGFMVGVELVKDRVSREPYAPAERIGYRVSLEARRQGLLLRPLGHVLVLMPPLITGRRDLARMVSILQHAIRAVTEPAGSVS